MTYTLCVYITCLCALFCSHIFSKTFPSLHLPKTNSAARCVLPAILLPRFEVSASMAEVRGSGGGNRKHLRVIFDCFFKRCVRLDERTIGGFSAGPRGAVRRKSCIYIYMLQYPYSIFRDMSGQPTFWRYFVTNSSCQKL